MLQLFLVQCRSALLCRQLNNKTSPQPSPKLGEGAQSLKKDRVINSCASTVKNLTSYRPNVLTTSTNPAFTLAEVLITLAIIGVVAAMTIPTLVQKYKEYVIVNRLNATYAMVSQAIDRMVLDNSSVDNWGNTEEERAQKFAELLPKYLEVVKFCPTRTKGCTAESYSNRFNSNLIASSSYNSVSNGFLLKNGSALRVRFWGTCQQDKTMSKLGCGGGDCTGPFVYFGSYSHRCAEVRIDINGLAKPNRFNEDYFDFELLQDGLIPSGSPKEVIDAVTFEGKCLGERVIADGGGGCSAWVIYNKNMDYLHCPDKLGWDKASSCK